MISSEQIILFKNLFKGREDVFAVRWEKDNKSGYMPAYDFDWNEFNAFRAQGGRLKNFPNKKYSKLVDGRIINHLNGKEVIGIYPLLDDNTSNFIVADFDENLSGKRTWIDECQIFMQTCVKYDLPVYLERSRSGKGGHVWMFFEKNYPAIKIRKLFLHILEECNIISPFDKNSNYDRLFPNQDYHTGKGLGNLVALPFQKQALQTGNSCFMETETIQVVSDQWTFLKKIRRVSIERLDTLYNTLTGAVPNVTTIEDADWYKGQLPIVLDNVIKINRKMVPPELILFFRENLNFINAEYIIKKKLGKNTYGTNAWIKMLKETGDYLYIPKGFIGKLLRYCKEKGISHRLIDKRKKQANVNFSFKANLYPHQENALAALSKKDLGIIVSPPGTGKTLIGLAIVAEKRQPALIVVHRKQLFDQWVERIQSFMGIAGPFIGKIGQGQQKIGTHITVAMMQSLSGLDSQDPVFNSFGTILVDECHHVPARTFREVIENFHSYYMYGLTATPIRKNNDERLIFIHLGDIIHEITPGPQLTGAERKLNLKVRETNLWVPFDFKIDISERLYQILIHDTGRNELIAEDIKSEVAAGRKVLVLSERRAHLDILNQYLKSNSETLVISGEDSITTRKKKFQEIREGHFQVLLSTGQFLGEGFDIGCIECLVLAFPFSFEGKLTQYIGRVQRSGFPPVIYDYRDSNMEYLEKMFRQRNKYYQDLFKTRQIQKLDEYVLIFSEDKVYINSFDNAVSKECLELPMEIERFKEVAWKIRVLNYDYETGTLMTEILDYNATPAEAPPAQLDFQFLIIDKIKFRTMDTGKFLNSVKLKKTSVPVVARISEPESAEPEPEISKPVIQPPKEMRLVKTMKVPFNKLTFDNGYVSFSLFIEELEQEANFRIVNSDIRPEFEAIKEYFMRIMKKKIIAADIEILFKGHEILRATAQSQDINKINSSIIDSVRFELVKRKFFNPNERKEAGVINSFDTLLNKEEKASISLFKSDQDLIDTILKVKDAKHYLQLTYLASQHLSSILKVRFILSPFSFLFLLAGENKYHIIWETLNSEEATYIWHFEKTMNALRDGLAEIENILKEIKSTNKLQFLSKEHPNFSRVIHDYSEPAKGFILWKGMLEEKLV
jgi:superfamily II DNA or RNA helicase